MGISFLLPPGKVALLFIQQVPSPACPFDRQLLEALLSPHLYSLEFSGWGLRWDLTMSLKLELTSMEVPRVADLGGWE